MNPIFGDVTVKRYARYLEKLLRQDFADIGVMNIRTDDGVAVRSWTALHEVVDANEYLILAEQHFGIEFDQTIDENWSIYNTFVDQAIDLALIYIGWTKGRHNA